MSDISLKLRAEQLGKSIEKASIEIQEELNSAVKNLAEAAYASMVSQVQSMSMNPNNRQDYLRGLKFQELGNDSYLIYLDGDWANKLEDGFPSYDMKETLLSSNKVTRNGTPWVKTSKAGKKYASVPFQHRPTSKDPSTNKLASEIQKLMATNSKGSQQRITSIFKNASGEAISGKVATIKSKSAPKNLQGLTKYQHVSKSGAVSSVYMTFRTISENSSGWNHPGHPGYQLFEEAKVYVEQELDNIIKTLL